MRLDAPLAARPARTDHDDADCTARQRILDRVPPLADVAEGLLNPKWLASIDAAISGPGEPD